MTPLRSRIGAFLFEQDAPDDAAPSAAPPATAAVPLAAGFAACVVGSAGVVVPVAAACAGELRARAGSATALLCVWQPLAAPAEDPPSDDPGARAGATTPAAKRGAARLSAHELPATACGRLAWLALDAAAPRAAVQAQRARALVDVPFVLALAGPRHPAFEPLLASLDLAVAVLPADTDPALAELAATTLPTTRTVLVPPVSPGPPRWAALAGLARLRSLPPVAP